jgi:hypothetical protein
MPLVLVLLAAMPVSAGQTEPASRAPLSLSNYLARLDALAADVAAAPADDRGAASDLLSRVPREWAVTEAGQTWRVPASPLRSALADWQQRPETARQEDVIACLRVMRARGAAFEAPPADAALARDALAEVLRADEFSAVRGPSAMDRLWQQVQAWIVRILTRVFGSSLTPTLTNLAIYAVIGLAVGAAGLWMYRALQRSATQEAATLDVEHAAARPWEDWLAEARADAAGERWTEAVRRAYWCGIAYLESRGTWRPDPSRTPREYLTLVPPGPPAAGLGGLTRLMERVWYGRDASSESSFDEAVAFLRSIGCPSA